MTIQFDYDHEDRLLMVTYIGRITPGEIPGAWTRFVAQAYENRGYNLLSDLSRADLSAVPMEDIETLAEIASGLHEARGISSLKVATYAPATLSFGMARAYEGMAIGSIEEIRTFRDLDQARAWLRGEASGDGD